MTVPAPFLVCPECRKCVIPDEGRLPEHERHAGAEPDGTVRCEGSGMAVLVVWLTAQVDADEVNWRRQKAEGLEGDAPWVPDLMLREAAFKRELIDLAESQPGYDLPEGVHDGRDQPEQERDEALKCLLDDLLRSLAGLVYKDRPGFEDAVR